MTGLRFIPPRLCFCAFRCDTECGKRGRTREQREHVRAVPVGAALRIVCTARPFVPALCTTCTTCVPIFSSNRARVLTLRTCLPPAAAGAWGMWIEDLARRAYFSRRCTVFYAVVTLLNVAVLVWVCADHKGHPSDSVFLTLEVLVTVALVLEVLFRLIVLRKQFWHSCCNVFDVVVAVLCCVSVVLYLQGPSDAEEAEDIVSESSLLLRNGLQVLRMLLWCRTAGMSTSRHAPVSFDVDLQEFEDVDLGAFDEEEFDFEETQRMLAQPGPEVSVGAGGVGAVR